MTVKIVPSALSSDYARIGEEVAALDAAGADRIQWDLMDGAFVPQLTFGPGVVAAARGHATCPFEAHLMVERPDALFGQVVDAGCDVVIVHPETLRQPHAAYQRIRELGARCGVALSPATPLELVTDALDLIDLVLIMTVNPGFGGQAYLATMEPKIGRARDLIDASGHTIDLEVDGGIGPDTIGRAAAAGADVFVSGSALWAYPDLATGVADLRRRATSPERGSPGTAR